MTGHRWGSVPVVRREEMRVGQLGLAVCVGPWDWASELEESLMHLHVLFG